MKRKLSVVLATFAAAVMLFSSIASGASAAKTITAYYRNIKISVNGKMIDVSQMEPFIYNERVYVPIRLVSEALDKEVDWDNNRSTVIINDKSTSTTSQLLAQKDAEINNLKAQNAYLQGKLIDLNKKVKELEEEIEELEEKKDDAEEYLEDYLYDEYSEWKDIEFDFIVEESRGDIELTIEFDRDDYDDEWDDLSYSKIENWLEDIFDFVIDEYPDADFEGSIVDTDEDETLVKFEKSGKKLKVKFYDYDDKKSYSELEDDLNDEFGSGLSYYDRDFGNLKADIEVDEYEYDDEIYITVIVNTDKYDDEWDDVYDTDGADDWLYDIMDYAHDELDDYWIFGHVEDSDGRTQATFKCTPSGKMSIDWE